MYRWEFVSFWSPSAQSIWQLETEKNGRDITVPSTTDTPHNRSEIDDIKCGLWPRYYEVVDIHTHKHACEANVCFIVLFYFCELHIRANRYRFICFRITVPADFIPTFHPSSILWFIIIQISNAISTEKSKVYSFDW